MDVLRRNEERLKAIGGVHYIDVGYRFVDGNPTDELAIRVHVHDKRPESELAPSEIVPDQIEGVPIDVIQSDPELQQQNPRDQRFDPLAGGIAIGNTRRNSYGTLGMIVFDAMSSVAMGLSNHHVLVGNTGQAGDRVAQPATANPTDVVGTVTRWVRALDCAVCTLDNSRGISVAILGYPAGASAMGLPRVGAQVTKSGRSTGITFGVIDGVTPREFTIIPDPTNPAPNGEISAEGDSGSVWLRVADSAAIGLHYAGERNPAPAAERAWAKRMTSIARALKFRLRL
jgi:hypothetical protein